jgi:hypothetical protein
MLIWEAHTVGLPGGQLEQFSTGKYTEGAFAACVQRMPAVFLEVAVC